MSSANPPTPKRRAKAVVARTDAAAADTRPELGRAFGSGWSRSMVKGVRANDLAGKAGEIASELEERLVRGHYRFGETLSIYTLAEQFDASRQPVAAAVLYLRSVGYLDIIPQVGCRVVSPTPQEVLDFYVLVSKTEAVISRFAAERHVGHEAEDLLAIADDLARIPFQSHHDRLAMADGISIFHDRISAMARSPLLVERISNLRRIFRFYLTQGRTRPDPVSGPPSRINTMRIELARSILARNGGEAERRTDDYILDSIDDWARVV